MKKFTFIKALWSPFKPFKLKWYIGKTAIGTPYFYPRKWVPNPEKPDYQIAIPKTIGFDIVDLGWKTKWDATDYRFEWAPIFSFVFFGYQLAITVLAPNDYQYWEAWLYYERDTDKTKSKKERIEQCKKEFPQKYQVYFKDPKTGENTGMKTVDYYELILKKKYISC